MASRQDAFLPRLAASISNRFDITRRSPRLAARGNTPVASVRSTRGKTWRQKLLDAAWVGGECAACLRFSYKWVQTGCSNPLALHCQWWWSPPQGGANRKWKWVQQLHKRESDAIWPTTEVQPEQMTAANQGMQKIIGDLRFDRCVPLGYQSGCKSTMNKSWMQVFWAAQQCAIKILE
jgi:hypothetical protein